MSIIQTTEIAELEDRLAPQADDTFVVLTPAGELQHVTYDQIKQKVSADIGIEGDDGLKSRIDDIDEQLIGRQDAIDDLKKRLATNDLSLDEAQRRLNAAENLINSVDGIAQSNSTEIQQNAREIALKANQVIVDSIEQQVQTNNAELSVQAQEIAARVLQSEYDVAEQRITDNAAQLSIQATAIDQRVTQDIFDTLEQTVQQNEASITINAQGILQRVTQTLFDNKTGEIDQQLVGFEQRVGNIETGLERIDDGLESAQQNIGTIGARSVLYVNDNGNLASINLLAGTEGSAVQIRGTQVDLQANSDYSALDNTVGQNSQNIAGLFTSVGNINSNISGLDSRLQGTEQDIGAIGARTVLYANDNGKLASIDLLAGTQGSAIRLDADQITISGATTFESGYDPSTKAEAEDLNDYVQLTAYNTRLNEIQNQIDGQIESYFQNYDPTINNEPAVNWNTEQIKQLHRNDTFTNSDTGESWRWVNDSQNGWYWMKIANTATQKALQQALQAQDTADGKRRVFTQQPVPPYDVGDLWVQGSNGDILRSTVNKIEGDNYNSNDWIAASKYIGSEYADNQRNIARDTLSQQLGFSNYKELIDNAARDKLFVNGGYLRGSLLETQILSSTSGNLILDLDEGNLQAQNFDIEIQQSGDFWKSSNSSFQFGGANGISYNGSGKINIGSDTDIFGTLKAVDGEFTGTLRGVDGFFEGLVSVGQEENVVIDPNTTNLPQAELIPASRRDFGSTTFVSNGNATGNTFTSNSFNNRSNSILYFGLELNGENTQFRIPQATLQFGIEEQRNGSWVEIESVNFTPQVLTQELNAKAGVRDGGVYRLFARIAGNVNNVESLSASFYIENWIQKTAILSDGIYVANAKDEVRRVGFGGSGGVSGTINTISDWDDVLDKPFDGLSNHFRTQGGNLFLNSDPFSSSGNYSNLRARATTASDVGLGNVRNVASYSQQEANSRFYQSGDNARLSILSIDDLQRWYSANGALQRVDARDTGDQAQLHWYGKDSNNATRNAKHAFYDGSRYVTFRAVNNNIEINRSGVWHRGNLSNPAQTTSATFTGSTLLPSGNSGTYGIDDNSPSFFTFYKSSKSDRWGYVGKGSGSNSDVYIAADEGNIRLFPSSGKVFVGNNTTNEVWHAGIFDNPFPNGDGQALGENNRPTFNGANFTEQISIHQGGDAIKLNPVIRDGRDDAIIEWYTDTNNATNRTAYLGAVSSNNLRLQLDDFDRFRIYGGELEINNNQVWHRGIFDNPFPNGNGQALGKNDSVEFDSIYAPEIVADTLTTELFKKNETRVMNARFVFSDGALTTARYVGGSFELKVTTEAFEVGDWVEVSWDKPNDFGSQTVQINSKNGTTYSFGGNFPGTFTNWPEGATVARINGNFIFADGASSSISGWQGIPSYTRGPFGDQTDFQYRKWSLQPEGVFADDGNFKGDIEAQNLALLGNMEMTENSAITMGDYVGGSSFRIGDFAMNGSDSGFTRTFGGGISATNATTSRSNSNTQNANINSNFTVRFSVPYDVDANTTGNDITNGNSYWIVKVTAECLNTGRTFTKSTARFRFSSNGNLNFNFTSPDNTSQIKLTREIIINIDPNDGFVNSYDYDISQSVTATISSSNSFIGGEGIKYKNQGNTAVRIDNTFNTTAVSNLEKDRLVSRNGRITSLDQNGNRSISIDPRGAIIFWQAKTFNPQLSEFDAEGAEAVLYIKRGGGNFSSANRNLGFIERNGTSNDYF